METIVTVYVDIVLMVEHVISWVENVPMGVRLVGLEKNAQNVNIFSSVIFPRKLEELVDKNSICIVLNKLHLKEVTNNIYSFIYSL